MLSLPHPSTAVYVRTINPYGLQPSSATVWVKERSTPAQSSGMAGMWLRSPQAMVTSMGTLSKDGPSVSCTEMTCVCWAELPAASMAVQVRTTWNWVVQSPS